jgi:hypothetical protein
VPVPAIFKARFCEREEAPLFISRTKRYENVVISFLDLRPSAEPVPPMSTFHGFRSDGDLREPE